MVASWPRVSIVTAKNAMVGSGLALHSYIPTPACLDVDQGLDSEPRDAGWLGGSVGLQLRTQTQTTTGGIMAILVCCQ